jgi:hypothetical protein
MKMAEKEMKDFAARAAAFLDDETIADEVIAAQNATKTNPPIIDILFLLYIFYERIDLKLFTYLFQEKFLMLIKQCGK